MCHMNVSLNARDQSHPVIMSEWLENWKKNERAVTVSQLSIY